MIYAKPTAFAGSTIIGPRALSITKRRTRGTTPPPLRSGPTTNLPVLLPYTQQVANIRENTGSEHEMILCYLPISYFITHPLRSL